VIENENIGISYLLLEDLIRGMATRVEECEGEGDTRYSIVISQYEAIHAKSFEDGLYVQHLLCIVAVANDLHAYLQLNQYWVHLRALYHSHQSLNTPPL
jgi:hypothetical protein